MHNILCGEFKIDRTQLSGKKGEEYGIRPRNPAKYFLPLTPPSCGDKCQYRSISGKIIVNKNPRQTQVHEESQQSVLTVLKAVQLCCCSNSECLRFIR